MIICWKTCWIFFELRSARQARLHSLEISVSNLYSKSNMLCKESTEVCGKCRVIAWLQKHCILFVFENRVKVLVISFFLASHFFRARPWALRAIIQSSWPRKREDYKGLHHLICSLVCFSGSSNKRLDIDLVLGLEWCGPPTSFESK